MVGRHVALGNRQKAGEARLGREQIVVARIERAVANPESDGEELARGIEQEGEVHLAEQSMGLVGDRLEPADQLRCGARPIGVRPNQRIRELGDRRKGRKLPWLENLGVAEVTADRLVRGLGPRLQLAVRSLATFGDERRGDVGQRPGVRGDLGERFGPGLGGVGLDGCGSDQQFDCLVEVPAAEGLPLAVVADVAGGLAGEGDPVADSPERGGDGKRLVDHLPASVGQRQQVPGEIATVDR